MDKAEKKAKREAWKRQQQAEARAALPLPDAAFEALFDALDEHLGNHDCDHGRDVTVAWLEREAHAVDPVLAWLDSTGGHCDCEVLMNSEEAWRAATGR